MLLRRPPQAHALHGPPSRERFRAVPRELGCAIFVRRISRIAGVRSGVGTSGDCDQLGQTPAT